MHNAINDRIDARIMHTIATASRGPHPADIAESKNLRHQLADAFQDIIDAKQTLRNARQRYASLMNDKQSLDSILADAVIDASR